MPRATTPAEDARRELREARKELDRVSRRDRRESDDYLRANDRVIEAEAKVAWFRR